MKINFIAVGFLLAFVIILLESWCIWILLNVIDDLRNGNIMLYP